MTYQHFGIMLADVMNADDVLDVHEDPFQLTFGWTICEDGKEKEVHIGLADILAFRDVPMLIEDPPKELVELMQTSEGRMKLGIWLDEYPALQTMPKNMWDILKSVDSEAYLWRTLS